MEFAFTGLDAKAESKERKRRTEEVKSYRTVNEIREEQDMDPLENGDIILDPVYLQYTQGKEMGGGGGEDLGPGESDGSEDRFGDDFEGGGGEDLGPGEEGDEDTEPGDQLERSQRNLLLQTAKFQRQVTERLQKSKRDKNTQVIEVELGE